MPIAMDTDQGSGDQVDIDSPPAGSENNNDPATANAEPPSDADADAAANGKQRMKRMTLNDAQKYEICLYMKEEEERSARPTNKAVATYIFGKYNIKVDESTVSRLKQQAETRLSGDLVNPTAKRHRQVVFPELEKLLGEFVQANKRKVAISDSMLLNKGKEIRDQLKIPEPQMKFSDGWLNKFKVRHGLKSASIQKPAVRVNSLQSNAGTSASTGTVTGASASTSGKSNNSSNNKRASSGNGSGNSSTALEKPRQPRTVAAALEHGSVDIAIQPPLASSRVNTSTGDTQLDVDMTLGTRMDIDSSDSDSNISMDQVLGQQSPHSSDMNAVELIVNSGTSSETSTMRMDILSTAYRNSASGARLLAPNSVRRANSKATSSVTTKTAPTPSSQLDNLIPAGVSSMGTDALSNIGLTGAGSEAGNTGTRPTPPITAARESLTMRLADPIAAAFQPEPPVDFAEAAQCVNTLRIFMQQQNFSSEQLEHLRGIYQTLDGKRKQQQASQSQQQF